MATVEIEHPGGIRFEGRIKIGAGGRNVGHDSRITIGRPPVNPLARYTFGMKGQWLAGLVLLWTTSATSAPLPIGLRNPEPATITRVIDGATAHLADGSELRLALILPPQPVPPRPGQTVRKDTEIEHLAAAARQALAALVEGKDVTLYSAGTTRSDRHGRRIAHVGSADGWVQAALVAQGLARVETTVDTNLGAADLLRVESEARNQGRGLWRHEAFRIRTPRELGRWIETFQIVEGIAVTVEGARAANRLALERDGARLALSLSTQARNGLRAAGDFSGKPIRVRGWVRWQNGPVIDVTHAAQLEVGERL